MGEVRIAPLCTRGVELLVLVCDAGALDDMDVGLEFVAAGLNVECDDEPV